METALLERTVEETREKISDRSSIGDLPQTEPKSYSVFVEQYLEKPVYRGDPQMLTLPTASTLKGIPLLDDF